MIITTPSGNHNHGGEKGSYSTERAHQGYKIYFMLTSTSFLHPQDSQTSYHNLLPNLTTIFSAGVHLDERDMRASPTHLVYIRDTGVAVETVGHFPTPIFLPRDQHLGPPVYPHIVLANFPTLKDASHNAITTLMATPHLVARICTLAPINMKVTVHERAGSFPVRV